MRLVNRYRSTVGVPGSRAFGDVGKYTGGGSNHLTGASKANQMMKPKLKHLLPSTVIKPTISSLSISHSSIQLIPDKYVINLQLSATSDVPKPAIYVCCLDVSDSMDGASTHNNSDPECSKFSRWDLVKHSMTTIVHCLRPVDKLAIVTFSGKANVNMKLINMDENGKRDALKVLDSIRPSGSTNLWDDLDKRDYH